VAVAFVQQPRRDARTPAPALSPADGARPKINRAALWRFA
jgi:hypothetical protein